MNDKMLSALKKAHELKKQGLTIWDIKTSIEVSTGIDLTLSQLRYWGFTTKPERISEVRRQQARAVDLMVEKGTPLANALTKYKCPHAVYCCLYFTEALKFYETKQKAIKAAKNKIPHDAVIKHLLQSGIKAATIAAYFEIPRRSLNRIALSLSDLLPIDIKVRDSLRLKHEVACAKHLIERGATIAGAAKQAGLSPHILYYHGAAHWLKRARVKASFPLWLSRLKAFEETLRESGENQNQNQNQNQNEETNYDL